MWENYYKKNKDREARPQLKRAVSFCINKKQALDLGSGNLIESKYLISQGFKVVAVDNSFKAPKIKNLDFKLQSFSEFKPNATFDIVNAQYSLPFHGKKGFKTFIDKINDSIKLNGIFVGQFFGKDDEWNVPASGLVFHDQKEILQLFKNFEILEFIQEKSRMKTASGKMKDWHIYHFIFRKIKE